MYHLSEKNQTTPKTMDPNAPLRPKPRRLQSPLPTQFLNLPAASCTHHHQMNSDGKSTGIINIISKKRTSEDENNHDELCGCSRCSPRYQSPPERTHNPLIHDVHFLKIHGHTLQIPS